MAEVGCSWRSSCRSAAVTVVAVVVVFISIIISIIIIILLVLQFSSRRLSKPICIDISQAAAAAAAMALCVRLRVCQALGGRASCLACVRSSARPCVRDGVNDDATAALRVGVREAACLCARARVRLSGAAAAPAGTCVCACVRCVRAGKKRRKGERRRLAGWLACLRAERKCKRARAFCSSLRVCFAASANETRADSQRSSELCLGKPALGRPSSHASACEKAPERAH